MVVPQELSGGCEEGWIAVSSKRTLWILKSTKNQVNEKTTYEPPVVSPPQVITVPYSSLFYEGENIVEEQKNEDKEIVQIEMEENVEGTTFKQNKKDPDQEYYLDKKGELKLLLVQSVLPK